MNRFFTFSLVLIACAVLGSCGQAYAPSSSYGAGPAVQQVSLSSLPNIEQYLNGASSYNGPAAAYSAPAYSAPAYAPASAVAVPSAPSRVSASTQNSVAPAYNSAAGPAYGAAINSYGASAPAYGASAPAYGASAPAYGASAPAYGASAPAYGASAPAYGASAPAAGYGTAPSYSIQPAFSTQLYPGQQNYKAYAAPTEYGRVSLPIIPAEPVAKLYVPQNSYGAGASY